MRQKIPKAQASCRKAGTPKRHIQDLARHIRRFHCKLFKQRQKPFALRKEKHRIKQTDRSQHECKDPVWTQLLLQDPGACVAVETDRYLLAYVTRRVHDPIIFFRPLTDQALAHKLELHLRIGGSVRNDARALPCFLILDIRHYGVGPDRTIPLLRTPEPADAQTQKNGK